MLVWLVVGRAVCRHCVNTRADLPRASASRAPQVSAWHLVRPHTLLPAPCPLRVVQRCHFRLIVAAAGAAP